MSDTSERAELERRFQEHEQAVTACGQRIVERRALKRQGRINSSEADRDIESLGGAMNHHLAQAEALKARLNQLDQE